jgi:ABC-type lipoprotein export system ATPase subunit
VSLGSRWRKWDLHVHTPDSLVHHYPGEDPWDFFLTDLAGLPAELAVIGINDYLFVDGYERVRREVDLGNLPNIEAVFPVVEFRLKQLVGTEGHLSRINLHVIFPEGTSADSLRAQFINGLSADFHLASEYPGVTWQGFPSRENLMALGASIRSTVPPEKQQELPTSDLELGFSNLVVDVSQVRQLLTRPMWKESHLLAVGKTEWASLKWTPASIAIKKDVINGAHLVFLAAASPAAYMAAKQSLSAAGVNARLLDCSDAHSPADSQNKDRLGNCFTWINADPTMEGLRHAVSEFDHRVFVGEEPSKLGRVRQRPSFHIRSVSVRKTAHASGEPHGYFDINLTLNPGFVAVVGNKGKGKSALLDVIGLLGNSSNEREFTFLNRDRFRNPLDNKSRSYEGELLWESGERSKRRLDEEVSAGSVERVTYLPQQLIDLICDPDPGPPAARFARELGNVLFAHVPVEERLDAIDLHSLIARRTEAIEHRLANLRAQLAVLNQELVALETKAKPANRASLETELADLKVKLSDLEKQAPPEPEEPVIDDEETQRLRNEIASLETEESQLVEQRRELEGELGELAKRLNAASQLLTEIETLKQQYANFLEVNQGRAETLQVVLSDAVTLDVDLDMVEKIRRQAAERKQEILNQLDSDEDASIVGRLRAVEAAKEEAVARQSLPGQQYEAARAKRMEWEAASHDLLGGTPEMRGIQQVEQALAELDEVPESLSGLKEQRRAKVVQIHAALCQIVGVYEDLYAPARDFIETHPLAKRAQLEFGATLRERDFEEKLWSLVVRNKVGTFLGVDEAASFLRAMIDGTSFSSADSVLDFVDEMDSALHFDLRSETRPAVDPEKSVRTGHSLDEVYDLIFGLSYLEPHYMLRYSGVPIDRLSPGEKGTLLLMFYLLVDPSDRPLLLDQPDENLDNQTIKELLVPALKEAKERRQVIVVTHNPNVAVVADADQVIVADFDGSRFLYSAGSIENSHINAKIVDVLEGTWPAFENREGKYQPAS